MQRKGPKKSKVAKAVKRPKTVDPYAELAKLRGTVKFTIDLETMKS